MEGFLLDSAATAQGKFLVNQQEQNEGQNVWEQFEFNWRSLVLLHASVCAYFRHFIYSTCGRDFCRYVTTMLFYLLLFSIAHVGSKKRADNKGRMKGKWRTVLEIKQSLGKL